MALLQFPSELGDDHQRCVTSFFFFFGVGLGCSTLATRTDVLNLEFLRSELVKVLQKIYF